MNDLHYGVVVGINCYPELDELQQAVGDAKRFAQWLRSPDGGGLEHDNVVVVTDDGAPPDVARADAVPTRTQVYQALYEFKQSCTQHVSDHPQDWTRTRLYVYVSGHGLASGPDEAALLMANAGPDWYGEHIPCAKVIDVFKRAQVFHEVVVFADCCRYWVDAVPIVEPPWTLVKGNNGDVQAVAGFATFFGDPAYEPPVDELEAPDLRRSYFTRALIEGLEGQAASSESGRIDSHGLASFVKARVRELTQAKRAPQTPQFPADLAQPIVFREGLDAATVVREQTHTVHLRFKGPAAGGVRLIDGNRVVLEEHAVVPVPWSVPLGPGLYRVVPLVPGQEFAMNGFFDVVGEDLDVEF